MNMIVKYCKWVVKGSWTKYCLVQIILGMEDGPRSLVRNILGP